MSLIISHKNNINIDPFSWVDKAYSLDSNGDAIITKPVTGIPNDKAHRYYLYDSKTNTASIGDVSSVRNVGIDPTTGKVDKPLTGNVYTFSVICLYYPTDRPVVQDFTPSKPFVISNGNTVIGQGL